MKDALYFKYRSDDRDGLKKLYDTIEQWTGSDEINELVESFSGSVPAHAGLEDRVGWLLDFCERWDFRRAQSAPSDSRAKENMRWAVSSGNLTNGQKNAVSRAVERLGLAGAGSPDAGTDYDYILTLGGAKLSCLLRTRLAASFYGGMERLKGIALLSAYRPVADSERAATDTYAPGAAYEFDLMNAALEREFSLRDGFGQKLHEDENVNKRWAVRTYYTKAEGLSVYSMAAPSARPEERRANSADTYEFFFRNLDIPAHSALLLVTSQIYVPYQQLEAVRTLAIPRSLTVYTVGFPNAWSGPLQGMNEPANYLQEIRSAIQAIDRFLTQYPRARFIK